MNRTWKHKVPCVKCGEIMRWHPPGSLALCELCSGRKHDLMPGGRYGPHDDTSPGWDNAVRAYEDEGCSVETIQLDKLTTDRANPIDHDDRSVDAIAASLSEFGQQTPIVCDSDGTVVAGNGTLLAARKLGWTEIVAIRTKLTGARQAAYKIADNRSAELSEWDQDKLGRELGRLTDELRLVAGFPKVEYMDGEPPSEDDMDSPAMAERFEQFKESDSKTFVVLCDGKQAEAVRSAIRAFKDQGAENSTEALFGLLSYWNQLCASRK